MVKDVFFLDTQNLQAMGTRALLATSAQTRENRARVATLHCGQATLYKVAAARSLQATTTLSHVTDRLVDGVLRLALSCCLQAHSVFCTRLALAKREGVQ